MHKSKIEPISAERMFKRFGAEKLHEARVVSKTETGNDSPRYKGDYITIMKSKFGPGWGVIYKGEQPWEYNGRKIIDFATARTIAVNLFDELHESRHREQPYWDGDR